MNNSPDLPLLFLLVQLLIAVVLLHVAALLSPKIEIPTIDRQVAIKLLPVVSVNIIGLVFNTLCLRGVEASFFQVSVHLYSVICNPYFNLRLSISDCSWPRPSIDNIRIMSTHPQDTDSQGHHRRCRRYVWFHSWYRSIEESSSQIHPFCSFAGLWCPLFPLYRHPRGFDQEFSSLLQRLYHSTRLVDERRLCCHDFPFCYFQWRVIRNLEEDF